MEKIKSLFRIVVTIIGFAIVFAMLGLIGSTNSIAVGGNAGKNNNLEFENNELNKMNSIYGNFMNEIYPIIMDEKLDFKNMTPDSINGHLNLILNLYPDISPIKTIDSIRISSKFGWRINPVSGVKHMHTGVDINMPLGTEIHSTMSGKVVEVITTTKNGYGRYVDVKNSLGFRTRYSHLSKVMVKKGDQVTKGQVIGTLGTSGNVTGPNLHYEIYQNEELKNPLDSLFMLKQSVKLLALKDTINDNIY
jgi:murein DD-endopeptidase MepM/ murein hydrolase activator NlpD